MKAFVYRRNARLTVHGRRILVERVLAGRPVAHVAAETSRSRPTAHKWVRRWKAEGEAGLTDGSRRPHTIPHRTSAAREARVCRLRADRKLGPARIGPILGLPASTVHRVLVRHGLNRLARLDRPGPPANRSAATNTTGPANWSMPTSRSPATSPTALAHRRKDSR